jgi:DNA phosphorothioation-associated putative methyltransferase
MASNSNRPDVRREKTAIARFHHSKPVALALSHGIIAPSRSVFDYGCGRGDDLRYLRSIGIEASGWDPHYLSNGLVSHSDIVNLGYVLNVIEDPEERRATLLKANTLAKCALVVAVRVDRALEARTEFSDGVLTSTGSFQKLYKQSEFRQYLVQVLAKQPHMAALGIAYIFNDRACETQYLAALANEKVATSRTCAVDHFGNDAVAQQYMKLTAELGRIPVAEEFQQYADLLERFGPPTRIERLAKLMLSPDSVQDIRRRRKEDILIYAAMMRLQGLRAVPFRLLSRELRADIKMLWSSYALALKEADQFLFQIGDVVTVRRACQTSPIGKKLPDAFYIHRSAEEQMGALLRLLVFAARQIVGEVDYNILKISASDRTVSFLKYDDFDEEAHPSLRYSLRVYLPRAEYQIRDYSSSLNPPILHRKELLVDPLHPSYKTFLDLTTREEKLGLLSRSDIGTKEGWQAVLTKSGLAINGHDVHRVT